MSDTVLILESRPATVLVIEDSAILRNELRDACEAAGYRVITAETGEEGLRAAALERPAAIVVDGVLPDLDGGTVIRRVRLDATLRSVPCLLLTASEERGAELRAFDAGADAFVRKENDVAVVIAKLAALLRTAASTDSPDGATTALEPKKILAVDNSPDYLHELEGMLRAEGYDVVLAHSGEEALESLAIQLVDCILLDLTMPGLSGQETCHRIKSVPMVRDVPLIMLTGPEDRAGMIDALGAGADDYIQKSNEFEVLAARVRAQIRRKQFEKENRRIRDDLLEKEIQATEARAAVQLAETRSALVGELERKNQELEAFSYSVSHDLRAPLRSIDGFSQALLEDYSDRLDPKGQDFLRRVRAAAQRMGELIDDLLELSRVGRAELSRETVNLSQLAKAVTSTLAKNEPTRRVEIEIRDGLVVQGDSRLLHVVLENLLGNAWKFTSQTAEARIEFGVENHNGLPVHFVRDDGEGFDMKYAEKLFQPFQRLHGEDFPGTGIGLATVHRIIERHGGQMWAEGEVGKGATVYFTMVPKAEIRV